VPWSSASIRSGEWSSTTIRRPERVEGPGQQLPGLPVAGQQQERLAEPLHLAGEVLQRQGVPEGPVLQQGQQGADRVRPGHDRGVDADDDPQPLGGAEGVRQLAEADRRGGVAHEVERVEEAQPVRPALGVLAGHQGQPQDAHGEDQDEHHERQPHPPQHQEDRGSGRLVGARPAQRGPADRAPPATARGLLDHGGYWFRW
jgi:hypothetical protein